MKKEFVSRRNKVVDLKSFQKRLTTWTTFDLLDSVIDNFMRENEEAYGVDFVIKRNNLSKKFAIFISTENRLKRKEDKKFKYNIGDLLLSKRHHKKEGVSLFKTFFHYI